MPNSTKNKSENEAKMISFCITNNEKSILTSKKKGVNIIMFYSQLITKQ